MSNLRDALNNLVDAAEAVIDMKVKGSGYIRIAPEEDHPDFDAHLLDLPFVEANEDDSIIRYGILELTMKDGEVLLYGVSLYDDDSNYFLISDLDAENMCHLADLLTNL